MLILDEKKIRKGRPVGLPYQGSKKKVAKKIVEIIKQNFGAKHIVGRNRQDAVRKIVYGKRRVL